MPDRMGRINGFTLIELLIVMVIILLVSVLTLPTFVASLREHPQLSAAQLVQASVMQARDATVKAMARKRAMPVEALTEAEALHGIRLVPEQVTRLADGTVDPSQPLVCSKVVPLAIPKAYINGRVSIAPAAPYPASLTGGRPCLVLEESPGHWEDNTWLPNEPTSWAWNLRAGERVRINGGVMYTICGPMAIDNPEAFVNYGSPGTTSGIIRTYTSPNGQVVTAEVEALLLVNGMDDSRDGTDGYVDNGWDGLDNDGDGFTDELDEWTERETWLGQQATAATVDAPYRIVRRPAPSNEPRGLDLPSGVVIDLTGWAGPQGRSRLVVDRHSGSVDLMVDRMGHFSYDSPYAAPTRVGMGDGFAQLWVGAREDIADPAIPMPVPKADARLITIGKGGMVDVLQVNPDDPGRVYLDARRGAR
jgi:prepilin-type N-terminal cleavage/methylation domain-containing protein